MIIFQLFVLLHLYLRSVLKSVGVVQLLFNYPCTSVFIGYPNGFTEEGSKGLISLLKRRLQELRFKQQTVTGTYRAILLPNPSAVEEEAVAIEEDMDWQHDNSSDDEYEDDDEDDL